MSYPPVYAAVAVSSPSCGDGSFSSLPELAWREIRIPGSPLIPNRSSSSRFHWCLVHAVYSPSRVRHWTHSALPFSANRPPLPVYFPAPSTPSRAANLLQPDVILPFPGTSCFLPRNVLKTTPVLRSFGAGASPPTPLPRTPSCILLLGLAYRTSSSCPFPRTSLGILPPRTFRG